MEFKKVKLDDLAVFTTGILLPRIKDPIDEKPSRRMIYNPLSKSVKYIHGDSELPLITTDQVGISMLQREAYLVEKEPLTDEQILTANFTAATLDSRLNQSYFVWWFNHSIEAQRQLEALGQLGRRVILKDLREMTISIPGPSLQHDVGKLYILSQKQAAALTRKAYLAEEQALQFIRQHMIKEG
ncbi:MAG: hypothetical protein ABF643_03475 [Oenococcus oeni]